MSLRTSAVKGRFPLFQLKWVRGQKQTELTMGPSFGAVVIFVLGMLFHAWTVPVGIFGMLAKLMR